MQVQELELIGNPMLLIYIEPSVRLIAEKAGCSPPHNAHFNFSGNKTLLSYRPLHSREFPDL